MSMEAVALDWLEDVRKTWKQSTYNTEKKRIIKDIIKPLGRMRIDEIKPADIRTLFQQLEAEGKYDTLRKIAENTVRIFNFGIAVGKCDNNPAYSIWKGLSFKRPAPNRGFATITSPDKVGKLLLAIETTMSEKCGLKVSTALRMAPYVFLRPDSLVWGEWTEIDFAEKVWRIPAKRMKMRLDHMVPLSAQALEILQQLHELTGEGRLMFPGLRSPKNPISDATFIAALRRMGYDKDEMTAHGFRAMASTLLNEQGYSADVIEKQLAHNPRDKIRGVYNRAEYLPERRKMMQEWADYLTRLREEQ